MKPGETVSKSPEIGLTWCVFVAGRMSIWPREVSQMESYRQWDRAGSHEEPWRLWQSIWTLLYSECNKNSVCSFEKQFYSMTYISKLHSDCCAVLITEKPE